MSVLSLGFVSVRRGQKPGICLTQAAYALEDPRLMSGIGQCFACHSTFGIEAPPERVFPLLCPVREHEWIPAWKAEMVHSKSGFAELDCVFRTNNPLEGNRTWKLDTASASKATERLATLLGHFLTTGAMLRA